MSDKLNKDNYLFKKIKTKYEIEMKAIDNNRKLRPCTKILPIKMLLTEEGRQRL
jgi:hypothetical protein